MESSSLRNTKLNSNKLCSLTPRLIPVGRLEVFVKSGGVLMFRCFHYVGPKKISMRLLRHARIFLYRQLGPNSSLCIESKIISLHVPPWDPILGSAGDPIRFERKAGTHSNSLVRKITCLRRLVPSEQNSDPPL